MDRFNDFRYVIVDYDSITDTMISESQTERQYLYVSERGTKKGVLRYVVNQKPSSLTGVTSYTHSQLLSITQDPDGDWITSFVDPNDL